jgi:hypothetical protein
MNRAIANQLLRLIYWLVPEFVDDMLLASVVIKVSNHIARHHLPVIEAYVAAYYRDTGIPPEQAQIVIERNGDEWTLHIDPRPQDWEEEPA